MVLSPAVQFGVSDREAQLLGDRAEQLLVVGADRPRCKASADENSEHSVIEHQGHYRLEYYVWVVQEAFRGADLDRGLHAPVCRAEIADDAFLVKPVISLRLIRVRARGNGRREVVGVGRTPDYDRTGVAFQAPSHSEYRIAQQLVHFERGHQVVAKVVNE